jgi:hypothetical protein
VTIPLRALLAAAACSSIAWSWSFLGDAQEVRDRIALIHGLLDSGQARLADFEARRLHADFEKGGMFDSAPRTVARLRGMADAIVAANELLQQHHPEQARARLEPLAVEADAPAVLHFLLGRALIQLGETAAGTAEQEKARQLAPDAPLFKVPPPKGATGRG